MFFVPTFIHNAGASEGGRSVTFIGLIQSADWGSVAIGPANATRRLFFAGHSGGLQTNFQFTANGNPAVTHVQTGHFGGSTGVHVGLASILVPTGTTCSIDGSPGSRIGVWVTYGMVRSTPYATNTDTNSGTSGDLSASINVPDNGFVIAAATSSVNASSNSYSWGGVTELYDLGIGSLRLTGANSSLLSAQTGRSIRANTTGRTDSGNELAVLSWN